MKQKYIFNIQGLRYQLLLYAVLENKRATISIFHRNNCRFLPVRYRICTISRENISEISLTSFQIFNIMVTVLA